MRKLIILIILLLSSQVKAQLKKYIDVSVGYGIVVPYDDSVDIIGNGGYFQGEYVFEFSRWFELRPYAGAIFASGDSREFNHEVISKAFLIGGKSRVIAPIPWFAPYLEIGIGTSIGHFKTLTNVDDINKNGAVVHIPFSIGVELGPKRNVDFGLVYYYHPSMQQFSGATAVGVSFLLN